MNSINKAGVWVGLWLFAVVALVTMLWHEDRFFALSGLPIAEVSKANRDVSYRSEDDLRWKSIGGETQVIFDGDKIATGRASNAIMDFGDGREAHIGEDTSVGISTIRQAKGMTYILTLPKGLLAIKNSNVLRENKSKNIFPIIVRAGGKDFLIEPGQEKGIAKTSRGVSEFRGERLKTLTLQKDVVPEPLIVNEPLPIETPQLPPPMQVVQPIPPPTPVKEAVKEKVAEQKPPTRPLEFDVVGSEIQIISQFASAYFTFDSLAALGSASLGLEWKEPAAAPLGWRPALEIGTGSVSKRIVLKKGGRQQLSWSDFVPLKGKAGSDGLPCVKLTIRGGAQIDGSPSPKWSFKKQGLETSLCSYRDAAVNVPIVVGISDLVLAGPSRSGVFQQQSAEALKYQMVVGTPSQYMALLPLFSRSKSIKVAKVPGFSESGIFIAKSGKIIMQLAGAGFNATAADQVMSLLGGDFVFKGARSSLYDATDLNVDQLKEWVSKSAQQGKKVYVHRSGTLLPISRDFLEERREVAAFVKAVASQLFVEKVEIIAFK